MAKQWAACGIFLALAMPVCARCQAGSNWDRVKQVDPGTAVRIQGESRRRVECEVLRVDDAQLVCSKARTIFFFPITEEVVFRRERVREVRLTRPVLSGLAGAGIGVGLGIGVGFVVENDATRREDPGLTQFVFGLLGGVLGGGIGRGSDFLGGPQIYRAP